jgi:hypothetical protein
MSAFAQHVRTVYVPACAAGAVSATTTDAANAATMNLIPSPEERISGASSAQQSPMAYAA